jgi:hypothetical protein
MQARGSCTAIVRGTAALCGATTLVCAAVVGCSTNDARNPFVNWRQIHLKVDHGFLSGEFHMSRAPEDDTLVVETEAVGKLLGATIAHSKSRSALDPASGRSRRYVDLSPKGGREYVFGETSYTVRKLEPRETWQRPVETWQEVSTATYDYPRTETGVVPVLDYYGMLVTLGGLGLDDVGDEAIVWVATSRGPRSYTFRVAETRETERSFRDVASGEARTAGVRELRLVVSPAEDSEEARGFLGMSGETEIWVEAASKVVLEVSGEIPNVPGRVVLRLEALE